MRNIKEFKASNTDIVYCLVDRTMSNFAWARELIKNQSDYTITNLHCKGYTVLQGTNEDELLKAAAETYRIAVVVSTGTEFITGTSFFDFVTSILNTDFFVYGHVLDRKDAYYEIHQQCYVVNLKKYNSIGRPDVGQQQLGHEHDEFVPTRSAENFHDDYTPLWVNPGTEVRRYNHKAHGWNLFRFGIALGPNQIMTFPEKVREMKKHYYPENKEEFFKHVSWAYSRERYCSNILVHTENTEAPPDLSNIEQIFTPAAGGWWLAELDPNSKYHIVLYDYNTQSLEYWRERLQHQDNVTYEFVQLDLLTDEIDLRKYLDMSKQHKTLINFSNIFVYEGTTFFSPLEFRLSKENAALQNCLDYFPSATLYFVSRAITGFHPDGDKMIGKGFSPVHITELECPTWHVGEWL